MNAARQEDDLVLRVDVSGFRDARDVLPRPARLTYGELVERVAPVRPLVRADLVEGETKRLAVIDEAERVLLDGRRPSSWLANHPTFRALEKAAWTAEGGDDARRDAIERASANARDAARRRTKTFLPCWSPVRCHPAATRGIPAVEAVTCLVLDYDDGTGVEEAVAPWLDWPLAVATTWSHTAEHPRFRVSLVLDRPVPAEAWPRAWRWAAQHAAGAVDPACKDPSRLYLLPALRSPASPSQRFLHDPGGHLLAIDWERLPEAAPEDRASLPAFAPRCDTGGQPPADAARRRARAVFVRDEAARRRAADFLHAEVAGRRAQRIRCPACARPSVWFWLVPGRLNTAACQHKQSCGWWGHLDELLDAVGGHHVG